MLYFIGGLPRSKNYGRKALTYRGYPSRIYPKRWPVPRKCPPSRPSDSDADRPGGKGTIDRRCYRNSSSFSGTFALPTKLAKKSWPKLRRKLEPQIYRRKLTATWGHPAISAEGRPAAGAPHTRHERTSTQPPRKGVWLRMPPRNHRISFWRRSSGSSSR